MQENRIERLKIYNHIKDQKIDYLNKWHQDTDAFYRANRAESADIINLMQGSLREYVAAYNTLVSLQRTEDSMVQSKSLDSTVVDVVDNAAETLAAFELQSNEFKNTQANFEEYMERLKEDIDFKAEKFGHIEYFDAKLRDGHSNEEAVAASEIHDLDERRKPLAIVNPLFAKTSELPPAPNIENITFEHISLNLPIIAKNALENLKDNDTSEQETENINFPKETIEEEIVEETVITEEVTIENSGNQEENESDNEEENDESSEGDYQFTEAELNNLSEETLQQILDEKGLEYDVENFEREQAVFDILESQGEFDNE
jgi:hypothetical protein